MGEFAATLKAAGPTPGTVAAVSPGLRRPFVAVLAGVLLATLTVAVQLTFYDRGVVPMDEGQLVAIAARLLNGEVLYRDVYTGVFPAIYYLTAGLLAAVRADVIVTRWAQLLINTVTALLLFSLARCAAPLRWAAIAALLYVALIIVDFPGLTMFNYSPLALVFGLGALRLAIGYVDSARWLDGVLVGALTAGAVLSKQNFGALVLLAILVSVVLCRPGSALARRSLVGALLPIATAGLAIAVPVAAYFAHVGALGSLVNDTMVGISGPQLTSFNNPIPPLFTRLPLDNGRFNFLYTPPTLCNYLLRGEALWGVPMSPLVRTLAIKASYGLALGTLFVAPPLLWVTRRARPASERRTALAINVFALLLFFGLFPSAIWPHLAFVAAPLLILAVVAAARVERVLTAWSRQAGRAWQAAWAVMLVGLALLSITLIGAIRRWNPVPLGLERATLFVSDENAALFRSATEFITAHTAPGEPIFVAPTMPLLYFLTDRRNPTPYDLTVPGDVRGPVIVDRLEATRTRYVVYNPQMYIEFPPFAALFPEVDEYLRTRYQPTVTFRGGLTTWMGLVRADAR
ncbi:MAG: ArnT family glycosyltransferase [Candidatus Binatia bacterium]